jgi:hypothetical protein
MPRKGQNRDHFVTANKNAKSDAVAVIVRAARRARLDYPGFLYAEELQQRREAQTGSACSQPAFDWS